MAKKQTTVAERQVFYQRHQQGETYEALAAQYGVSPECVRYWCRRQRDGGTVYSRYQRTPRGFLSQASGLVRYVILRLRLEHPHWGPKTMRHKLKQRPSLRGHKIPSVAGIGRYLHQWSRFRRGWKPKPAAEPRPDAPSQVHQCWQLDFKVDLKLADGSHLHLHTVRDPVGEVCIGAELFLREAHRGVQFEHVQAGLRHCFSQWGTLPDYVQTDGDPVLVGRSGADFLPSRFTLWLRGLGIAHRVIRPGQPTDNAEVERCHRTVCDYAIVGNEAQPLAQLQTIVAEAVRELAYELPSEAAGCAGQPPVEAHPQLLQPRRPYQAAHEWALFDLSRVDAYLATFSWERIVDKSGQVYLGQRRRYSLGRGYARQLVRVCFDPTDRHFVFYPAHDPQRELARRPARGLSVTDLTGLPDGSSDLGPQQLPLPWSLPQGVSC